MALLQVQSPFEQFFDLSGDPLDNGSIYIGVAGLNPQTNPILIFWDIEGNIPAAQPLKTRNGYIARVGTPARVYVNAADFSITVKEKNGRVVYTALNVTSLANAASVTFLQSGAGAVARSAQDKMRDFINAADFGVVANGVTDDTARFQAAMNEAKILKKTLRFSGNVRITSSLLFDNNTMIQGDSYMQTDAAQGTGSTDTTFAMNDLILIDGVFPGFKTADILGSKRGVRFSFFGICPLNKLGQDLAPYGSTPDYSVGITGIDLSYTLDAEVDHVCGKSLESLVSNDAGFNADAGRVMTRPILNRLAGYNNFAIVRVRGTNNVSNPWFAADMKVRNISMVRHNVRTLDLDKVDGCSVESSTFFQTSSNNCRISRTNFLNMSGMTIFETGDHALLLDNISGFYLSGIVARGGWYHVPQFTVRYDNIRITNSVNGVIDMTLDAATGYAYNIDSCSEVTIKCQSSESQHGQGNLHEGIITNSPSVKIDHTMRQYTTEGSPTGTVFIDNISGVAGSIVCFQGMGALQQDLLSVIATSGYVKNIRVESAIVVPPGGSGAIGTLFVKVPPFKTLRVKHFAWDFGLSTLGTRVANYFFANTTLLSGTHRTSSLEPSRDIIDNSAGPGFLFQTITLYAYNTTAGNLSVPIGAQLSVGLSFV